MRVSVIIITRNEAHNIADCLRSVAWADEIVVVDSGSDDGTPEVALQFTDKVYAIPWYGYSANKNFALSKATGEWVLWLDADERVPEDLAHEIQTTLAQGAAVDGYEIPRLAFFMGRWIRHGGWYPAHVLRLFRRGRGHFSDHPVHEGVVLQGSRGRLRHPLLHYTDLTLEHYFGKLNTYTTLSARMQLARGKSAGLWHMLARPLHTFVKMYVFKAGFLDGVQGLMLALLSAGHTFAKYAKVWYGCEQLKGATEPAARAGQGKAISHGRGTTGGKDGESDENKGRISPWNCQWKNVTG
jgi:glycosyltransferase involved in cell wall biosynthesis